MDPVEHLPEVDHACAGGAVDVVERPAVDPLLEVGRILASLSFYISDDEEEVSEDETDVVDDGEVEVGDGELNPLLSSDGEEESEEDDHDLAEEEDEDVEEDREDDDITPCSPLVQWPLPIDFWHRWRAAGLPWLKPSELRLERREDGLPPVSARSEEDAPSTSGLGSSSKRSRKESNSLQVSVKRRRTSEDSDEDTRPSTSGLASSTKRSREESDAAQVGVKRQRTASKSQDPGLQASAPPTT